MRTKNKISEGARLEYIAKQNIFIEAIAKVKWPRLLKDIAMVIYRKTLMFNKMSDCISRKQIADALGWERNLSEPKSENKNERNITKAIRQLEALQVIAIKKRVMPTRGGYLDEYTLLDPTGWLKYKHKRGVNANASKSPPKRRKYAPERGVNTHTEEAFAQTPNKLNTNKKQIKEIGELKECSPSGEVAPPGSSNQPMQKGESDEYMAAVERSENSMPKEVREMLDEDNRNDFEKFLVTEATRDGEWAFANNEPLPDRQYFHEQAMLIFREHKYPEKVRRLVEGLTPDKIEEFWDRVGKYIERVEVKQARVEEMFRNPHQDKPEIPGEVAPPDSTDFEEENAHPSEPEFSEIQLTPRDKAIAYAKAFVEKEQVRGRPGYDGPGLFEDDYEALIDLTVAGTMFDGWCNEEKHGWIWTKYYPILDDPRFLDLIDQCKSNAEEMDLSEF